MRTLYYINGKRVDINTYYSSIRADYKRKIIWDSCVSYYKKHPKEFNLIYSCTKEKSILPFVLMTAWENTEDYKNVQKKLVEMDKRDNGCLLVFILVFGFLALVLPFILLFSGALD